MGKRAIRLYYQPIVNNFGDMLSPRIVAAVTGRDVVRAKPQAADLLAVGSLLDRALIKRWRRPLAGRLAPLLVWGGGFLFPGGADSGFWLSFMAVRGRMSGARIRGLNGNCAVGDPGLLASALFPKRASCSKQQVLLIPSLVDQGDWIRAGLDNEALGATHAPVTGDTDMLLHSIANADLVITSSLHVIIVSISYGVQVVWVAPDENSFEGGDWKYRDFFSAFEMQPVALTRDPGFWATTDRGKLLEAAPAFAPMPRQVTECGDRLAGALAV